MSAEAVAAIDGITPGRIVFPESVAQLGEAIADEKGSVVPLGSGTQLQFGNPLRSADCAVSLSKLSRITTYNPAELTIHVEAGMTLGEIQSALAPNKQALPLDPWCGPDATIGGIASTNAQGSLRAVGSIRDWIIGMKVVHIDGRISKTGGRVVKNVTGYDLAKLYTGSLGSLVIISEISFKLRAQFARTASAIAHFETRREALAILEAIRKSPLQPISCVMVCGPSGKNAVGVRFGEHPQAVAWQIAHLPAAPWKMLEAEEDAAAADSLRDEHLQMGKIVLRVIGLPSQIASMIEEFNPVGAIAHGASGIVHMALSDAEQIAAIRAKYPAILERAPIEVRRRIATFGVQGTERRLMQELKRTFDPAGRLNPGRHIDGE